jgi:hypothetical protein
MPLQESPKPIEIKPLDYSKFDLTYDQRERFFPMASSEGSKAIVQGAYGGRVLPTPYSFWVEARIDPDKPLLTLFSFLPTEKGQGLDMYSDPVSREEIRDFCIRTGWQFGDDYLGDLRPIFAKQFVISPAEANTARQIPQEGIMLGLAIFEDCIRHWEGTNFRFRRIPARGYWTPIERANELLTVNSVSCDKRDKEDPNYSLNFLGEPFSLGGISVKGPDWLVGASDARSLLLAKNGSSQYWRLTRGGRVDERMRRMRNIRWYLSMSTMSNYSGDRKHTFGFQVRAEYPNEWPVYFLNHLTRRAHNDGGFDLCLPFFSWEQPRDYTLEFGPNEDQVTVVNNGFPRHWPDYDIAKALDPLVDVRLAENDEKNYFGNMLGAIFNLLEARHRYREVGIISPSLEEQRLWTDIARNIKDFLSDHGEDPDKTKELKRVLKNKGLWVKKNK